MAIKIGQCQECKREPVLVGFVGCVGKELCADCTAPIIGVTPEACEQNLILTAIRQAAEGPPDLRGQARDIVWVYYDRYRGVVTIAAPDTELATLRAREVYHDAHYLGTLADLAKITLRLGKFMFPHVRA